MTTTTLAKGLARRTKREVQQHAAERCDDLLHEAMRCNKRASAYRMVVRYIKQSIPESLIALEREVAGTRRLDKLYTVLYLAPLTQPFKIAEDKLVNGWTVQLVVIPLRDPTRYTHKLSSILVSAHAVERVFQRLKTQDSGLAMKELGNAIAEMVVREPPAEQQLIKTEHGAAIFVPMEYSGSVYFVLTTWIDEAKLRPEQREELASAEF